MGARTVPLPAAERAFQELKPATGLPSAPETTAATPVTPVAVKAAPTDAGPQAPFAFGAAMDVAAITATPVPQPVAEGRACHVLSASYGGRKTLLVRANNGTDERYTALTVLDGFEGSMLDNYVKTHAPGGVNVGEFATRDEAIAKARQLCRGTVDGSPNGTRRAG